MSIRVMTLVWDGYPGGGSELLALLALADWSDDDGRCWPSIASIAKKTRLSPDQARRVVHRLINAGYLAVRDGKDGGRSSRRYQIKLGFLTPGAHATPCAGARGGTDARGPLAPMQAHPLHSYASRTVIDTSVNHQEIADEPLVSSKAADPCPHQAIIDLYHQALPTGRHVRSWTDTRKAKLRARWKEDTERQCLDWWGKFFRYVAKSDFLTGKTSTPGRRPFEIDLEWIVTPSNFVKILEGKYENGQAAITPATPTQQEAMFRGCI